MARQWALSKTIGSTRIKALLVRWLAVGFRFSSSLRILAFLLSVQYFFNPPCSCRQDR